MNYKIENITKLTNDLLSLRIRAQSPSDIIDFAPGQYAAISFVKNGQHSPKKCFSFANSSIEKGVLEFGVRIGGDFTTSLTKLAPGDEIAVMGPYGNFISNISYTDDLVFFAGGIGLTPFLSVVRTAVAQNWPQKITLFYSVRTAADAAYTEELFELSHKMNNFNLFVFLSKEDASQYNHPSVLSGQISGDYIEKLLNNNLTNKKYFICGPPAFMAAMRTNLTKRKVPSVNIRTEEFSTDGNSEKSNPNATENKVNRAVFALVLIFLLFVAIVDSSQYNARLNAATPAQNSATTASQPSGTTNSDSSQTATSPTAPTSTGTTQSNINSTTSPSTSPSNQNTYTPPRTRVS